MKDQDQKQRPKRTIEIYKPPGLRDITLITSDSNFKNTQEDIAVPKNSSREIVCESNDVQLLVRPSDHSKIARKLLEKKPSAMKQTVTAFNDDMLRDLKKICPDVGCELIDKFFDGKAEDQILATEIGELLSKNLIEGDGNQNRRNGLRVCTSLLSCPSGFYVQQGIINALERYYETRGQLRSTNFQVWNNYLFFISEFFSSFGKGYDGPALDLLLKTYEYLLDCSQVNELKVEELEFLLSSLLNVGSSLEQCRPDALSNIRDQARDAFLNSSELCSRKMLLLIIELAANGWEFNESFNEYYLKR